MFSSRSIWPLVLAVLASPSPPATAADGCREDLAEVRCAPPTGAEEDRAAAAKPTFRVANAEELITAIGPDRTLRLAAGEYLLSDLDPAPAEHLRWKKVHDGYALVIHDLSGLAIVGPESGIARIAVAPRYADVLAFERVEKVKLERLELAHAEGEGTCTGGVLRLEDASEILLARTVLHGSGVEGLTVQNVRGGRFTDNEIRGTTERMLSVRGSTDLRFENNRFFERRRGAATLYFENTTGVEFVGNRLAARLRAEASPAEFFRLDSRSHFALEGFVLQDRVTGEAKVHDETLSSSREPKAADRGVIPSRVMFDGGEAAAAPALGGPDGEGEEERVSLEIPGLGVFALGSVTRVPTAERFYGVDPESIVARRLGGDGDPILVTWNDYAQGMGNYQSVYYFVAGPAGPSTKLLEGQLGISGSAGWASHRRAEVSFGYSEGVLERRVETYEWSAIDKPQPLAQRQSIGSNWYYVTEIEKTIIDRWRYQGEELAPLDARTFYRLGEGDLVETVAEHFGLEPDGVRSHEPWRPGAWVRIDR